jgi:two-component system sensor histidine kinase DesK
MVRPRLPRIARLLGPLVGLFFLVYPVSIVLETDPTPGRVFVALGGAALFAGVFLWLMWLHEPLQLAPADPAEVLKCRVAIAFLTVLAIALSFILSQEWRVLFFHLNVAAGIMLLSRDAYVAIAVLAVIQLALGIPTGLWWLVVPMAAIGLWGTAFVSQVAAVAELRAARKALARHAVAEERLRFARDLHDLLGHSLSLITLKSELAARLLPAAPERAAQEIRETNGAARRALREVREAVAGYRQPTLREELLGAEEMLAAAGIACRIENDAGPLPQAADAVLAWAVREGTTNVIRHSRARHCAIRLTRDAGEAGDTGGAPRTVRVEISDDGHASRSAGHDANAGKTDGETGQAGQAGEPGGSGLPGLAERVAAVAGADFEVGPLPDGGFRLRVSVPLGDGGREEGPLGSPTRPAVTSVMPKS